VERRDGTDVRPLIRLTGVSDPRNHRGQSLLVEGELGDGEWLASQLVGCQVEDLGRVRRVLDGASCDVLELEDGTLIPLVSDAIASVDPDGRAISIHREFLGLEERGG
jgi:ribosomal 30S subunit maturation factor RimM